MALKEKWDVSVSKDQNICYGHMRLREEKVKGERKGGFDENGRVECWREPEQSLFGEYQSKRRWIGVAVAAD